MEMSKCLCLMIIAVIVIAANASPFRERRNGGNHGNQGQGWSNGNQGTNSYSNTQNSESSTTNNCNGAGQYCCNNAAQQTTNGRRKRNNNGQSTIIGFLPIDNSGTHQQYTCGNTATGGASGDQYNGCEGYSQCCQGNTSSGSLLFAGCSDISTSSSPSS
ncbi:unnamed protein product [Adineta steineri]|uniref:Hydrophobin n=1 Tax=Adineta steineri TaxID=433720 RepID=A0A819YSJ0_9BILA|nr:unnamed protein product [Adineta steineri]